MEEGIAESVFEVALLEYAPFIGGLGGEDPQEGIGKDWGKALGLVVGAIFLASEDGDATLGAVWIVADVLFDP